MITITPEKDKQAVKALFSENGISVNEYSSASSARSDGEILGYCLYDLYNSGERKIIIHKLYPVDDIALADGILRSALYVAAQRGITDAFYSDTADEEVFKKLDFIKSVSEKRLSIDKLFGGCHCKN